MLATWHVQYGARVARLDLWQQQQQQQQQPWRSQQSCTWQLRRALVRKHHQHGLYKGHFLRRCSFFACDRYLPCKRPLLGVRIGEAAHSGPLSRLTLAEARSSLRLAPCVTVREVPGDGSCLFHSLLSLAQALRQRSAGAGLWNLTSMRNHLDLPAPQEPTDDQITSLCHSLGLRLVIFSVELQNSSAVIDGVISYTTPLLATATTSSHFTLMTASHERPCKNYVILCKLHASLPVRKHDKHLHLAARLRSHHGWRPLESRCPTTTTTTTTIVRPSS